MGFFRKILKFIVNASIPIYKFQDNAIFFKTELDDYFKYELGKYDIKTRHDPFVVEAYTIRNKDIFLEYIKADENATWRDDPLDMFQTFIQKKMFIKDFKVVEDIKISNYTFRTYLADNSFAIHLIHINSGLYDVMIVGTKGNLYRGLLSELDSSYKYKFYDEQKVDIDFNISMVKDNWKERFFSEID